MKKYLYGLYLVALCMLCSGCGSNGTETGAEQSDAAETSGEPTVLVYGYIDGWTFQDLDPEIEAQIVKFNRSQSDYVIEIKKYGEDDYNAGLRSLNADIAAGTAPDIIQVEIDTQLTEYAKKGVLADLYTFLDEDIELSREDFFESVLAQMETDGTLCGIVPFFTIWSTIGNPNYIDSDRVTLEELQKMCEDGGEVIPYQPLYHEDVLGFMEKGDLSTFVDWEKKTCDFTSEEFIRFLEFSGQFGSMMDSTTGTYELYKNMQENKVCMVNDGPIDSFEAYTKYKSFFGQDAILIGWPSIDGCGPVMGNNFPYLAINNESKEKDGAWRFVRSFLQTDFLLSRDNQRKGFPILKEAFELQAQKAMEVTWGTDEEGNTVEVPGSEGIIDPMGKELYWPIYAATQEEVAYIRSVIENLEVQPDYGEIYSIIFEEIQDYWSGVKSAEDVAEVIQNRAKNYLNEIS